jgi:hypothetical protein
MTAGVGEGIDRMDSIGVEGVVAGTGVHEKRIKVQARRMDKDGIFCMEAQLSVPGNLGAV